MRLATRVTKKGLPSDSLHTHMLVPALRTHMLALQVFDACGSL